MNPLTLSAITDLLNRDGWNYEVFLESYTASIQVGSSSRQVLREALERDDFEEIRTVTAEEALLVVKTCLSYVGDKGAGPDPDTMKSEQFEKLLSDVLDETAALSAVAARIEMFRLKQGIFWQFGVLFTCPTEAVVLVGSADD